MKLSLSLKKMLKILLFKNAPKNIRILFRWAISKSRDKAMPKKKKFHKETDWVSWVLIWFQSMQDHIQQLWWLLINLESSLHRKNFLTLFHQEKPEAYLTVRELLWDLKKKKSLISTCMRETIFWHYLSNTMLTWSLLQLTASKQRSLRRLLVSLLAQRTLTVNAPMSNTQKISQQSMEDQKFQSFLLSLTIVRSF